MEEILAAHKTKLEEEKKVSKENQSPESNKKEIEDPKVAENNIRL